MGRVPKVNIYQDKKSGNWGIGYSVKGKRFREIVASKKTEAIVIAADYHKKLVSQDYDFLLEPKSLTIEALIQLFLDSKKHHIKESSFRRYRTYVDNFKNFMAEYFATIIEIRSVREIYIKKFMDDLFERGLMAKTINGTLTTIKQMFKYAVLQGYLRENPIRTLKKFPLPAQRKVKYFSKNDLAKVFNTVDPHWRDALEFITLTGLRKDELIHLEFGDLDLKKKTITIQGKVGWAPKTKRLRTIPLNEKALEIIKRQEKSPAHNYIFKGKNGGKVHKDKIYVAFKRALKKTGLSGDVHKLRHTFASHLAMNGVDPYTLSELMGHTDISMTKIYAHLAPDHMKKAIEKLNGLI